MGLVTLDDEDRSRIVKGSTLGFRLEQEEKKGSGISVENRRVYSPVTFQDIARRSIGNSPIKTTGTTLRTNLKLKRILFAFSKNSFFINFFQVSRSNSMGASLLPLPITEISNSRKREDDESDIYAKEATEIINSKAKTLEALEAVAFASSTSSTLNSPEPNETEIDETEQLNSNPYLIRQELNRLPQILYKGNYYYY